MTIIKLLQNKRIIVGVTGGIAVYKAAMICSRLIQSGAIVDVVMTPSAQKFMTPLSFQALTHRPVYTDMFDIPGGENIPHVTLSKTADLLLIAPATANTLSKLAQGAADNILTAIALSTSAPILLAPAMETQMWNHPATQENIEKLRSWGASIVGPVEGRLASGATGSGRMVEPEQVIDAIRQRLSHQGTLGGQKVVVTAGGTREALDPVRFISNHSSGKMGHALAEVARDRGAIVTLITTMPLPVPAGITTIRLDSATQMRDAVLETTRRADILLMAAAVADFRPSSISVQKIKKKSDPDEILRLEMVRNPDILLEVASQKSAEYGPRITVGFAAESEDLIANARSKLERKKLDLIVANDITAIDAGFAVDTNRVTLLLADGTAQELPLMSKRDVAEKIFDTILKI